MKVINLKKVRQNYGVIPGVQFMAQCGFFKDILLSLKLK